MKVKFNGLRKVDHHFWFTNIVENAKKLETGKIYNVTETNVASSWTAIKLVETGNLEYNSVWFEQIN